MITRYSSPEAPCTGQHRSERKRLLRRLTTSALALAVAMSMSGCKLLPTKLVENLGGKGALYDGKSKIAYGTELPVTSVPEALQRGDLAVANGDLDKGLFLYVSALELDENNPQALARIGQVHASRGNPQLAELAFRWSLQKDPRNPVVLSELGIIELKKRDYIQARQHLEQSVALDHRNPRAHNALGVIADLDGDYKRAQGHYQQAIAGAPGSASLFNNLGYSRYLGGDLKGAIAAFREALLADPDYQLAWRNLALVYTREKRYDEAVEALAKVQDLPKAYNDVGYVAMIGGKLDDANGLFEEAKRRSADFYTLADANQRRIAIMQGRAAAQ